MKYIVMIGDGMADYKIESLGNKTPLQAAKKPMMDYMAQHGEVGYAVTVPQGMVPESDTANLGVIGYDPTIYSKGRSPLEALSIGLHMTEEDTAYRCNIVTLSEDGAYEDLTILDHSADEITTPEADLLIKAIDKELGNEFKKFYTGISYRHCLLWKNSPEPYAFMRPHDILGKCIREYLPKGKDGEVFLDLMKKSFSILNNHPVNNDRRKRGLRPANSIWLWSPGKKPQLPLFNEKYKIKASVISAVDLIKGIGICAGMHVLDVEGVTGNYHTNYAGKAKAALDELLAGQDYVYIHVEAPDECGHRAEIENKIYSIEKIDELILKYLFEELGTRNEAFKVLLMPDHPTPIALRTHVSDPVPFVIYSSNNEKESGVSCYDEFFGGSDVSYDGKLFLKNGYTLMDVFLEK
jgi:proposed homoserine kinase